jgi:hypothetical protein
MSLDGYCDGDCGQPAVLEIEVGGESGYFCAACAPTGKARPHPRPCPACGHALDFKGEDRDGRDVWRCPACDTFGE